MVNLKEEIGDVKMSTDIKKLVQLKAKSVFKGAELEIVVEGKKVGVRAEGTLNDVSDLFSKISEFAESTSNLLKSSNIDLVLSIQGIAFSFELEIY